MLIKHLMFLYFGILGIFSFGLCFIGLFYDNVVIWILLVGTALASYFYGSRCKKLPHGFNKRYLPVMLPLLLTACLWGVCNLVSVGFYGHDVWGVLAWTKLGLLPMSFFAAVMGRFSTVVVLAFVRDISFLAGFTVGERRNPDRLEGLLPYRRFVFFGLAAAVGTGTGLGVQKWRDANIVRVRDYGFEYAGGLSSVNLNEYDVTNPDNILPKLTEPADFFINKKEDMPILDGAEAAFPVYSAFAAACYNGAALGRNTHNGKISNDIVTFTNTIYAFERLVNEEVDIFFGAMPSAEQIELAEQRGVTLKTTAIGQDAFIFVVSNDNPVDGLTSDQIREIYAGKIRNWRELGGKNERILAFQRPENSGSQTIMTHFMGDKPLASPLKEEFVGGMEGVYEQVAEYRGQSAGIGYSFRFFAQMAGKEGYKMLSVDGVSPTIENIGNGAYPFTVSLYAVTREENKKEQTEQFVSWMQGRQGQEIVERVGYTPVFS